MVFQISHLRFVNGRPAEREQLVRYPIYTSAAAADRDLHTSTLGLRFRHPFSKACLQHSQTVIQPCVWFMEQPSQFSVGQTAQSLNYSIMENPHAGLNDSLKILLACFRKRMSASGSPSMRSTSPGAEAETGAP